MYPFSGGRELMNTSVFGGNTGRQGVFDPEDEEQYSQAIQRLQQLQGDYGDRLSLNYTGDTGLAKNDRTGYATMQNAKTEAQNIQNIVGGRQPLNIRFGGDTPGPMQGLQQAGTPETQDLKQKRINYQLGRR